MTSEIVSERAVAGEFWRGMRLGFPVVVASAPFGLLFGALSVENGFTVFEAFLMSATVYAGASQMVGIGLFGQKVAPWLIVLSILAVNFRHVLYSAAVGRHLSGWPLIQQALGYHLLTDPQYVLTEREAEERGKVGFAWYLGAGIVVYVCWVAEGVIGAVFGSLIPDTHALGIDFLLPIYFLGLVMGFRKRPLWLPVVAASAVASIIAYKTVGSPWHVTIGAMAGILFAAIVPAKPDGEPLA
ncbi:branched-chain amino acid ABC transporter permease [Mesorhizobium sp. Root554]|uniref:AzlC family ABC transporter permease n=1 Tax=unclassified Mesorhizobium TaxID=325217 RepID=UPI0006F1FE0E|nr:MULTISPECIES: AzlC family ABC transporter permease [unclassified Mesorhizobium]KQZ14034.1 branched-chain amino acid ABC transporter permease [Mesorhizobium sp. Root1471]KQZ36546.1 branched-chain amino acid ABC transporter permease [Mesorhizobium sp. Root554]